MTSQSMRGWCAAMVANEALAIILASISDPVSTYTPSVLWIILLPLIFFLVVSWPILVSVSVNTTLTAAYVAYFVYLVLAFILWDILLPSHRDFASLLIFAPVEIAAWGWLNVLFLQIARTQFKTDTVLHYAVLGAISSLFTNPFWTLSLFLESTLGAALMLLGVLLFVSLIIFVVVYVIRAFLRYFYF